MLQGYLTKTGALIVGLSTALATLPQDMGVGTYHGATVTIGHIGMAVGFVMSLFGLRRAVGKK